VLEVEDFTVVDSAAAAPAGRLGGSSSGASAPPRRRAGPRVADADSRATAELVPGDEGRSPGDDDEARGRSGGDGLAAGSRTARRRAAAATPG